MEKFPTEIKERKPIRFQIDTVRRVKITAELAERKSSKIERGKF